MKELKIINQQEVLGKDFKIYGDYENPLFLAKDVAEWIDYAYKDNRKIHRDASKMIAMVDDDEKVKATLNLGGEDYSERSKHGGIRENVEMWFLTEDGLYEVLMQSRKPIAKQFKKKVKEILKEIRKTGQYSIQKKDSYMIEDPIERANRWIEEQKEKLALQAENEQMKPKALFADCVTASETSILVRDFAKILRQNGAEMGEKRLYKWFRDNGYIIKGTCQPTQKSMEMGLFEVIERTVSRGNKPPITTMTTKITGKGQIYFINKILDF